MFSSFNHPQGHYNPQNTVYAFPLKGYNITNHNTGKCHARVTFL